MSKLNISNLFNKNIQNINKSDSPSSITNKNIQIINTRSVSYGIDQEDKSTMEIEEPIQENSEPKIKDDTESTIKALQRLISILTSRDCICFHNSFVLSQEDIESILEDLIGRPIEVKLGDTIEDFCCGPNIYKINSILISDESMIENVKYTQTGIYELFKSWNISLSCCYVKSEICKYI